MKTDIWMPFYIADYYRDTMHLSTVQHGAYCLLLLNYWVRQAALPDDNDYLANVTRLSLEQWLGHRPSLCLFFSVGNGRWVHGRVEKEILKAQKNRQISSEKGKMGANRRWHGQNIAQALTQPMLEPIAQPVAQALPRHRLEDAPSPTPPHTYKKNIEDVRAVFSEIGMPEREAERFFNYYESNGWRVGRNPMKSLKHAAANWKLNIENRTQPNRQSTNRNTGTANNPNDYAGI
jgi:uncharacterized protein YdaU (DUF1376 family)